MLLASYDEGSMLARAEDDTSTLSAKHARAARCGKEGFALDFTGGTEPTICRLIVEVHAEMASSEVHRMLSSAWKEASLAEEGIF